MNYFIRLFQILQQWLLPNGTLGYLHNNRSEPIKPCTYTKGNYEGFCLENLLYTFGIKYVIYGKSLLK